jgi:hypothetical protein
MSYVRSPIYSPHSLASQLPAVLHIYVNISCFLWVECVALSLFTMMTGVALDVIDAQLVLHSEHSNGSRRNLSALT